MPCPRVIVKNPSEPSARDRRAVAEAWSGLKNAWRRSMILLCAWFSTLHGTIIDRACTSLSLAWSGSVFAAHAGAGVDSVQLTDQQAKQLRTMQSLRTTPPTLRFYYRASWRAYLLITLLAAAVMGAYCYLGWFSGAAFFAGLLAATLLRDLKWLRQFVKAWPLSNAITDWTRVDALLCAHLETTATRHAALDEKR